MKIFLSLLLEADITMLRRVIDGGLSRHYFSLRNLGWRSLQYLANEMYAAGFISLDIKQSPTLDNIMAELTVELNSMTTISQIEQYCNKVLSILANTGGLLDYTNVDRQQLQDQSSSNTLSGTYTLIEI